MEDSAFEELKLLDRENLVKRMAEELPEICEKLNITQEALADKTGVDVTRIRAAEFGKRPFKWSEYMAILFVIWNNDIGKGILDSKDLFPDALKKAMSVNRNAHLPVTESRKYEI